MTEVYPHDAALLALASDQATGVEYIPTGVSPYHLHFRKMLYRLLRACERANDLRVYQDGDLTIGIRPGKATVGGQALAFAGESETPVTPSGTTDIWLDDQGQIQQSTSGLPTDATSFIPLAQVVADQTSITSITDRRGEAMLQAPSPDMLGLSASVDEINQALDGISAQVSALALTFLCAGSSSVADSLHTHRQFVQNIDDEASLKLQNTSTDVAASAAVRLSLSGHHAASDTRLLVDASSGFVQQSFDGKVLHLVGVLTMQESFPGDLTASVTDQLVGAAPIDGRIERVFVTVGTNIQSSDSSDRIAVDLKVDGNSALTTQAAISSAAGSGSRSTAKGDGTEAVVASDGSEVVTRGDLIEIDITRTAVGTVSIEAADVACVVLIAPGSPH